jgi:aminoglycoside 3-N-acetyltransferase
MSADTIERPAVQLLLQEAAVPRDGVLFLHSAFRKLASRGLSADPFIAALLDEMRDGTLVMPTMSWRIVTPANPIFDELATPSHVGILTELYRRHYASHRSLHPTHSVAALGRQAEWLTSGHHLGDVLTPCSLTSPYGRAGQGEAHIILLGVGLERCTAIHHAEEMIAPEFYLEPADRAQRYECRSRHGIAYPVRLRRHRRLARDFPQFEAPLAAKDKLRSGTLVGTPWIAVAQRDLLAEVTIALERDQRAIVTSPAGDPAEWAPA